MDVGNNNYFYGCRSWLNVDDGWDGYLRGTDDVSTVLENCWTWMNGYFLDGSDGGASANGNGFKVGGSDDKTLIRCCAPALRLVLLEPRSTDIEHVPVPDHASGPPR